MGLPKVFTEVVLFIYFNDIFLHVCYYEKINFLHRFGVLDLDDVGFELLFELFLYLGNV